LHGTTLSTHITGTVLSKTQVQSTPEMRYEQSFAMAS